MAAPMKWVALMLLAAGAPRCDAVQKADANKQNVIDQVVMLMSSLKEKIQNDGEMEQESYDKYACWCEETLSRKAADITAAKESIDALNKEVLKLKGELATHKAEIGQLKKNIAANIESQREATEVREKERAGYEEDKNENEQCMGALEAAIKVLHGAGTGKKAALVATMQEAQILSVVAGVKSLLRNPLASKRVSSDDMRIVEKFVSRPEDFIGGATAGAPVEPLDGGAVHPVLMKQGLFYPNELGGFLSALQVGRQETPNPYGDYAPQSDRITGILKSMYDSFATDIEKNNVEEAEKQKAFEELMATKQSELESLQATLDQQTMYDADKTKKLAETKTDLDNTKEQLAADEKFFASAKDSCKVKAGHWANRVKMRTEEMKGIDTAVHLLSSDEGKEIFDNATSTFLQLGMDSQAEDAVARNTRNEAYGKLQAIASKFQSVKIARMAVALTTAGHFDEVIVDIDKMIGVLRKEEQQDIEERDFCENRQNANKNMEEDLGTDIEKLEEELQRSGDEKKALQEEITELEGKMNDTQEEMDELLADRTDAEAKFRQSVKDDTAAIELLGKARDALAKFYEDNDIKLALSQKSSKMATVLLQENSQMAAVHVHHGSKEDPEYKEDPDKAPETIFKDGEYAGSSSESGGLVAIVSMIQEDFQKEIDTARKEDVEAQKVYEEDRAGLQEVLEKLTAQRNGLDKEVADLTMKVASMEGKLGTTEDNLELEKEKKATLGENCDWVATHFDSRRDARKAEIDGLIEAKNYLAGMDSSMASDQ